MIGEATFANPRSLPVFLPPLVQRAAFLIEAERNTQLLEGVGISPLLSSDPLDHPLIVVRGAQYHPTIIYDICLSLTSDREGKHYYLRGVNLTRHPLTYRVRVIGKRQKVSKVRITRFAPSASTTTSDLSKYNNYVRTSEELSLPLKKGFDLTLGPYEVVLLDLSE